MKNKWKITIAAALLAATSVTAFSNIGVKADNVDMIKFDSSITATTPHNGNEISVVHSGMESVLRLTNVTPSELGKYYYFTPDMQEFNNKGLPSSQEEIRACYDNNDDFAPINNTLAWNCEESAESYTVNVALDKSFTKVVFSETVEETSVYLGNTLYSGTNYYWQVIANGEEKVYSEIFEFSTKAGTRTIDLDGVSNTRDVGGYQTPNGKTMQGLIYRTARLDDITDEGRAMAAKLGFKTDLDLREVGEGQANPLGIQFVNATPAPVYTNGINTLEGKAAIKTVFQTFANKDSYPIVMHCSVGRDRTGTATALLNALLGVDEQTIVNEYLLSVFAYISSWNKVSDALMVNIQGLMSYVKTFEGETLAEQAENLLLDAGVTAEEIQAVRDIMLGNTQVYDNTVECDVSYENMHFVTVKAYGYAREVWAVKDGVTFDMPFVLDEDSVWTVNGVAYDFSQPVTEDFTLQAAEQEYIKVLVSVDGAEVAIKAQAGDSIDFSQFAKDGYTYKIMDTEGNIISSLTVTKDCAVSVVYFKN